MQKCFRIGCLMRYQWRSYVCLLCTLVTGPLGICPLQTYTILHQRPCQSSPLSVVKDFCFRYNVRVNRDVAECCYGSMRGSSWVKCDTFLYGLSCGQQRPSMAGGVCVKPMLVSPLSVSVEGTVPRMISAEATAIDPPLFRRFRNETETRRRFIV
jgi:hypothetical protein